MLDRRAVHARREHRERRSGARGVERRAVDKIERGDPPAGARSTAERPRHPLRELGALPGDLVAPQCPGHFGQVVARAGEHGAEAGVEHTERAGGGEPPLGPAGIGSLDHERQVALVVLGARPLGCVDVRGVPPTYVHEPGLHAKQGPVPLGGVVPPRLPRVDQDGLAEPVGIPLAQQEPVPFVQRPEKAGRPPLVGHALEHQPQARGRQRRLCDSRDRTAVDSAAVPPPRGSRQVGGAVEHRHAAEHWSLAARAVLAPPERDVGEHPVAGAPADQRLELGPRPAGIDLRPAEAADGGVPVPLVRVDPGRRNGPAPRVVCPENGGRGRPERQKERLAACRCFVVAMRSSFPDRMHVYIRMCPGDSSARSRRRLRF